MRLLLPALFIVLAPLAGSAPAQTSCKFENDYYTPVDIHPTMSFAANQKRVLGWLGCDPGKPEVCAVPEQTPRLVDMNSLRRHVWEIYAKLNAPAKKHPMTVRNRVMPRWMTWYTYDEVFQRSAGRSQLLFPLTLPRQLQGLTDVTAVQISAREERRDLNVTSQIRYNRTICEDVRAKTLDSQETLNQRLAAKDNVRLADESLAVKTSWLPVAETGCSEIPVFDSQRAGVGGAYSKKTWRQVAVSVNGDFSGCNPAVTKVGINRFFSVSAQDVKTGTQIEVRENGRLRAIRPGDFLVLVGLHFTTREIPNWGWATFWWHDRPDVGSFAANRPRLPTPWNNYLMNLSYDMDYPKETNGEPPVVFNPYLEGSLDNGAQSNCMSCHSRASWPLPAPRKTLASLEHLRSLTQIVVRGSEAAEVTYFPERESSLFLDFIWSLSRPPN